MQKPKVPKTRLLPKLNAFGLFGAGLTVMIALGCTDKKDDSFPLLPALAQPSSLSYTVDFLTPQYYLSSSSAPFRTEVDAFLTSARATTFSNPLGSTAYTIPSTAAFGTGKGPSGTNEHHPAVDLHPADGSTNVNIYAAHAGVLTRCQTLGISSGGNQYRHFISIATDVKDGSNVVIVKIVTIYGHLALDQDSGMPTSGASVTAGQLISQHLTVKRWADLISTLKPGTTKLRIAW